MSAALLFSLSVTLAAPPALEAVSLDEAVKRALDRSPATLIAREEIRRAGALLEEARSSSLPGLSLNGTYTRLDADRLLGTRIVAGKDQLSANVTLAVPLLAPGRWSQWRRGRDGLEVAEASEGDVRRQLALATARAYLAVVAQKRGIVVQERARDTAKAHLEFARQRFQGGVGNKLDLVRTEQEAETDEALVEGSRSALGRAREALGVLCGSEGPLDAREEEPVIPAVTPAEDLDRRGDVKVARARQAQARSARGDAWLDWLPTLLGTAQAFYQNPPSLVTPETGWQAQLVLSVPLYEGGLRAGQVRERDALSAEADLQLEATLRQARSEVRVAVESLRHADAGLAAAKRAADRAREALDLATRAWQAGSTTNLEVVDAERRARDAETAAIIAEDGVRQGRLDVLAALGRFP